MTCENLFSGKNKKKKSKCRLLEILPRMLRVKMVVEEIVGLLGRPRCRVV